MKRFVTNGYEAILKIKVYFRQCFSTFMLVIIKIYVFLKRTELTIQNFEFVDIYYTAKVFKCHLMNILQKIVLKYS